MHIFSNKASKKIIFNILLIYFMSEICVSALRKLKSINTNKYILVFY